MEVDNLRELRITSTTKGMLCKCIGNINEKKVFIKTGSKVKFGLVRVKNLKMFI